MTQCDIYMDYGSNLKCDKHENNASSQLFHNLTFIALSTLIRLLFKTDF